MIIIRVDRPLLFSGLITGCLMLDGDGRGERAVPARLSSETAAWKGSGDTRGMGEHEL